MGGRRAAVPAAGTAGRARLRDACQIGDTPAGLLRWADEVLRPRLDWRRALAAELRKAIEDTAAAVDYSYCPPSRRAGAAGSVVLPALRRPVPEVALVCDTSGSMSDDMLAASLAEVEGLLAVLGRARELRVRPATRRRRCRPGGLPRPGRWS